VAFAQSGNDAIEIGLSAGLELEGVDVAEVQRSTPRLVFHFNRRELIFVKTGRIRNGDQRAKVSFRAKTNRPLIETTQITRKDQFFSYKQRLTIQWIAQSLPANGV
jgi:hypothetical protein